MPEDLLMGPSERLRFPLWVEQLIRRSTPICFRKCDRKCDRKCLDRVSESVSENEPCFTRFSTTNEAFEAGSRAINGPVTENFGVTFRTPETLLTLSLTIKDASSFSKQLDTHPI